MDEQDIWARATEVFRDTFDEDDLVIEPATTAADVEDWDSLTNIQLIVALEQAFGIRINTGEMASLANVGDLMAVIIMRVNR